MAVSARFIGALRAKTGWMKETTRSLVTALAIALIVAGGYLAWHHFKRNTSNDFPAPASLSQVEKGDANNNNESLKAGDYHTYQINKTILAQQYLDYKDYNNAERIMNEVFSTIPASKVNADSYIEMIAIEKGKGDQTKYRQYLQLAIPKLRQEGSTSLADAYQKILDGK